MPVPDEFILRKAARIAARHGALDFLALHGSRARGEASPQSDWDVAYLAADGLDLGGLIADLTDVFGSDRVDAADLSRASAVLRYRVARDGILLHERSPGLFERFAVEAASFWCDVGDLVQKSYGDVLSELDSMSLFDVEVLGEKVATVERHLARVAARLPANPEDLRPGTDESDAVILHLWQATQIALDLAMSACVKLKLGAPANYGEAFRRLAAAGHLEPALASRLVRAAGFRNVIAHAYETVNLARVHDAASRGPADSEGVPGRHERHRGVSRPRAEVSDARVPAICLRVLRDTGES